MKPSKFRRKILMMEICHFPCEGFDICHKRVSDSRALPFSFMPLSYSLTLIMKQVLVSTDIVRKSHLTCEEYNYNIQILQHNVVYFLSHQVLNGSSVQVLQPVLMYPPNDGDEGASLELSQYTLGCYRRRARHNPPASNRRLTQ